MATQELQLLDSLINKVDLHRALPLFKRGSVYNVKRKKDSWSCYVLGRDTISYRVDFLSSGWKASWSCECSSKRPCVHLGALLFHLFRENPDIFDTLSFQNKDFLSRGLPGYRKPQVQSSSDGQLDLFEVVKPDKLTNNSLENNPVPVDAFVGTVSVPSRDVLQKEELHKASDPADALSGLPKDTLLENSPDFQTEQGQISRTVINLSGSRSQTEISLVFLYGQNEVRYSSGKDYVYKIDTPKIKKQMLRDRDAEGLVMARLCEIFAENLLYHRGMYSAFFSRNNAAGDMGVDICAEDFLTRYGMDLMAEKFELRLKDKKISMGNELKYQITTDLDWFGVKVQLTESDGELSPLTIDEGFESYGVVSSRSEYVVLKKNDLKQLEYLRRQGLADDGELTTSPANLSLIDTLYEKVVEEDMEQAGQTRELYTQLRNLENLPVQPAPDRLNAELRNYQQEGYNWMLRLHEAGLNGCLADDMGLGKTVQTIAVIQGLKERLNFKTSLLICPVVTLANWEAEISRFAPNLKFTRHAGQGRTEDLSELLSNDLIIISYHTLRNDIELFLEQEWDYLILDEAHYIKNSTSRIFKAIRSLKSRHRLSLTGTPMENNTLELWSQMDFLNPGLLGSKKSFYERFAVPIEKNSCNESALQLKEIVDPFILRRKKEDVLDELPPKEETVFYCEMEGSQMDLYRQFREYYRLKIEGLLDEELKGGSLDIFRYLLRLRQLAIYPPLAGDDFSAVESCKMDVLFTLMDEIMEENHKVLIFSQFMGTLDRMGELCKERDWKYSLLTGSTPDREEQIRRFQEEDDVKVFLLSLKAGGVGINLTAADYVFLFDPWWNPAAERQAMDRAHRMGQKRPVMVYKLIVKETIEEKILQLQNRKQALMNGLISSDSGVLSSLDAEEVRDLFD